MQITNISEAKASLSQLIERVLRGEEVIIGKAGKPVAKLVPFDMETVFTDQDERKRLFEMISKVTPEIMAADAAAFVPCDGFCGAAASRRRSPRGGGRSPAAAWRSRAT